MSALRRAALRRAASAPVPRDAAPASGGGRPPLAVVGALLRLLRPASSATSRASSPSGGGGADPSRQPRASPETVTAREVLAAQRGAAEYLAVPPENVRTFSIVAHVDHGKSTLADRLMERAGAVPPLVGREQYLDRLPVERQRGITVKAQSVSLLFDDDRAFGGETPDPPDANDDSCALRSRASENAAAAREKSRRYLLNLVDTPGHADFAHEVARSLAACEGAVVLVDATQGVQAQTIATVRAARSRRLALVPAANKIDAPHADVDATREQMRGAFGADPREVVPVSAKTGEGVEALLRAIVDRIPSPVEARRRAFFAKEEGEEEGEEEEEEEGEGEGEAEMEEEGEGEAETEEEGEGEETVASASSFTSRPFRGLLLDSRYDAYRGAVLTVRVFDGEVRVGDRVAFLAPRSDRRVSGSDLPSSEANDAKRTPGPGPGPRSGSVASPPRDASEVLELGMMTPEPTKVPFLRAGHVGYVITAAAKGGGGKKKGGKKKGADEGGGAFASPGGRVGDTLVRPDEHSRSRSGAASTPPPPPPSPLAGFRTARPMVFQGLFPASADQYELMRATIRRVAMNDASVAFEEETSAALGPGFRCGFLGLLHADVFRQRLAEEAARGGGHLEVIATAPAVSYQLVLNDAESGKSGKKSKSKSRGGVRVLSVSSPADFDPAAAAGPRGGRAVVREPLVEATIVAPADRVGGIVELCASRRGERLEHRHLDATRVAMTYRLPLGEVAADFADALKSRTAGFATVDFSDRIRYAPAEIVRVDVSVNGQSVDALSFLTHASNAARRGRVRVERLAAELPRQLYEVAVRATVQPGNRVVASEKIGAVRKNVLAKCYGGDVSRKKKLLAKQKEGKKRMKKIGNVDVPHGVFQSVIDA